MIKRALGIIVAALLLFTPAAFAAEIQSNARVFDDMGLLSVMDAAALETSIAAFQESTGYDFAILITGEDLGDTTQQEYVEAFTQSHSLGLGMNNTLIVCYLDMGGGGYYYVSVSGDLAYFMVDDDILYLVDTAMEYFYDADLAGGFQWTMDMLAEALANIGNMNPTVRVYDYAGLLSTANSETLESAIAEFKELSGMDFLFLSTSDAMEGNENGDYMTEFYGMHGFGEGEERSGVALYMDLYGGNFYIQNFGEMNEIMTQEDLSAVAADVTELMNDGRVIVALLQVLNAYSAYFRW